MKFFENMKRVFRLKIFIILLVKCNSIYCSINPKLVEKQTNSIVLIEAWDSLGYLKCGTGFYISENIIATNFHVIENAYFIKYYFKNDTNPYYINKYLYIDTIMSDLILLYTEKYSTPLEISKKKPLIGEEVWSVGNPNCENNEFSLSQGIMSNNKRRPFDDNIDYYQVSVNISQGSSGSPLLNKKGQVIGIITATDPNSQLINYALPFEKNVFGKINIRQKYVADIPKKFKREIKFS